ncbi:hypothetical protein [Nesterenkonia pannonica]|uniref:hypothetical protein n=1 Tax=Nesterenkonia pannonica TaxID=1548602 RepID=UPI0021649AE0|nr:hypothetical protein [Nesterenkonia pannonica]
MAKDQFNPEKGEDGIPENPAPSDGQQAEGQGGFDDEQAAAADPAADPWLKPNGFSGTRRRAPKRSSRLTRRRQARRALSPTPRREPGAR